MEDLLKRIVSDCAPYKTLGKAASYIPELSYSNTEDLGITVATVDGKIYSAGDFDKPFTVQSIIKPVILLRALMDKGVEAVESIVGIESTGKPFDTFNYSDRALRVEHINPMINAGAIALCTLIDGRDGQEKFSRLLALARTISGNDNLKVDEAVYASEREAGSKNRALAYMLKTYKIIDGDIEDILDIYFHACSTLADCRDLAKMALVFANHGNVNGVQIMPKKYARYVNAVMSVCGMYDGSGEFALRVGIPAKSGVGGGIMATVPSKMGIGIFSPALDGKGNSVAGVEAVKRLSEALDLSIF